jgi:hypothetical protein
LRVLARQKGLVVINILGLSIGLACFSMFLLYTVNELNYDRFHKHAANIYRVYSFLDENLDRLYKAEKRWNQVVGWAGIAAVANPLKSLRTE